MFVRMPLLVRCESLSCSTLLAGMLLLLILSLLFLCVCVCSPSLSLDLMCVARRYRHCCRHRAWLCVPCCGCFAGWFFQSPLLFSSLSADVQTTLMLIVRVSCLGGSVPPRTRYALPPLSPLPHSLRLPSPTPTPTPPRQPPPSVLRSWWRS